MKAFKEFLLDANNLAPQTLYLPSDAEIVGINYVFGELKLLVLASLVDPSVNLPKLNTFKIYQNNEIIYAHTVKYIGSFKRSSDLMHVVKIVE